MKVLVFNDRVVPMALSVDNGDVVANERHSIDPQCYKLVDVQVKEDTILYLKIGETGQAFLSSISLNSLQQSKSEEHV